MYIVCLVLCKYSNALMDEQLTKNFNHFRKKPGSFLKTNE